MGQRIQRFGIGQTAKVMGVMYALMGLIFIPFLLLANAFAPGRSGFGVGLALAMPVLYGVVGAVFAALGCAVYNMVAGWIGGIEIELEEPILDEPAG